MKMRSIFCQQRHLGLPEIPPPPPHGHHLGQLSEYSPLNTSRKKFEGIIAKILDVLRRVQKP
jgi:hypothetical protein